MKKYQLLLLIIFALSHIPLLGQKKTERIATLDFVQVLDGNKAEAMFYYENNWKILRQKALKQGKIHSYQLLEVDKAADAPFHLVLITTYANSEQYDSKETAFRELIEQSGSLKLLNDKKPSEFRSTKVGSTIAPLSKSKLNHYFDDMRQILKNMAIFSQTYMNADHEQLSSFYTPDGRILPSGPKIIEGREAIKKWWILPEGVKISLHKLSPQEVNIKGNEAYDIGYYEGKTLKASGEEVSWQGKYVIIWKKLDGKWKIHIDIWNRVNEG